MHFTAGNIRLIVAPVGAAASEKQVRALPQAKKTPQRTLHFASRRAQNARMPHSIEYTACMFLKEEHFLEQWMGTVEAALPFLGGWRPDYNCNNRTREARRLALAKGEQTELCFEEAVISNGREGLAAIDIHLRSSARLLIVRLTWDRGKMAAETRLDGKMPW